MNSEDKNLNKEAEVNKESDANLKETIFNPEEIKAKLEKCEQENSDYLDGWKRAKADLINYKKDEGRRFEEVIKFGNMELIQDFIPVLNSFDLALSIIEKEGKAEKGVYMIRSQLEDVLKKRGLEKIKTEPGKPFDPNFCEAIGEIGSDYPSGSIAHEIETGYILNGRVVKPARVKLSKNSKS